MTDVKELSRETLRLQIALGSQDEVWAAFEELMRRNMEEEQESTSLVEITLKNSERWRKLHREDPDATIDIYEEFDGAIEELNFLREQLEEIKKWSQSMDPDFMSEEILEILGKEFERSEASLISRHVAARKHLTEYSDSHEDWQLGRIRKWKEELESLLEGT
ncbi:MAG: hypothetical protein KAX31_07325 [Thermoplasmata archaeon]|nr:hypothetical protein [Thermoplasmata archaeon]